jgi:hypothetical protein
LRRFLTSVLIVGELDPHLARLTVGEVVQKLFGVAARLVALAYQDGDAEHLPVVVVV